MGNVYSQIMNGLLDQVMMNLIHKFTEELFLREHMVEVVITSRCQISGYS